MNGSLNTIFPPRLLPFYGNSSLDTQSSEATYYISAELASLTAAAQAPTPPKPHSLLAKSKVQQKKERDKHSAVYGSSKKLSKLPSFRRLRHLPPIKLRFYVMSQHIVVANARRARVLILQRYSTVLENCCSHAGLYRRIK